MTNEEKAEEYLRCKWSCGSYDRDNKKCIYKHKCISYHIYLDGLAEGRKEGYAQGEQMLMASGEVIKKGFLDNLEKENAELKKQNESLKNTLQAIATDTHEHITHNVAQNELDKWEPAE